MRLYEKAVIIAEPWVSMILSGEKTWEMRSMRTRFTGPVALIRKGSGTIVGIANVVGCLPRLTSGELALHEPKHRLPPAGQHAALENDHLVPWVMREATRLTRPVPYLHRSGQQIWVLLGADLDLAIQAAMCG
jgi:hypothetical protein